MTKNTPDGGPAMPFQEQDGAGGYIQHNGMTLRDYFAAAALHAIPLRAWDEITKKTGKDAVQLWAASAYATADAMLAARKEGK